jgi:hypothetical protein
MRHPERTQKLDLRMLIRMGALLHGSEYVDPSTVRLALDDQD